MRCAISSLMPSRWSCSAMTRWRASSMGFGAASASVSAAPFAAAISAVFADQNLQRQRARETVGPSVWVASKSVKDTSRCSDTPYRDRNPLPSSHTLLKASTRTAIRPTCAGYHLCTTSHCGVPTHWQKKYPQGALQLSGAGYPRQAAAKAAAQLAAQRWRPLRRRTASRTTTRPRSTSWRYRALPPNPPRVRCSREARPDRCVHGCR